MNPKIIIVKLHESLKSPVSWLDKSFSNKEEAYYSVGRRDVGVVSKNAEKYAGMNNMVAFIISGHDEKTDKDIAKEIYLGYGGIGKNEQYYTINYIISRKYKSEILINNFIDNSEIDLENDYQKNGEAEKGYILFEDNYELAKQIYPLIDDVYIAETKKVEEQHSNELKRDEGLSKFAQKNEDCKRVYSSHTFGNATSVEERSEYQRDYERIVHSRAFRRLVDKAQIFTSSKGDHYRTRMTHTLEVNQIARAIALGLNLNVELTEAIALAHDLGHTPFGHRGERALDNILKGKTGVLDNEKTRAKNNYYGGFKHNFQGIRVVDSLEDKYVEHMGIDLSYQVLEGILKHTKLKVKDCAEHKNENNYICNQKCFDINEFFYGDTEFLFLNYDFPTTLEGQVVAIADEIAQCSHDLDDAFASKVITIDELRKYLELHKAKKLLDCMGNIDNVFRKVEDKHRIFVDKERLNQSRIVSVVISYFIEDIITNSKILLDNYDDSKNMLRKYSHRYDKKLIEFSSDGTFLSKYLQKIISKKVISNPEVSLFDERADMIITNLFRAYYNNPKLLHINTLRKIMVDIRAETDEVIDFVDGSRDAVQKEISYIKNPEKSTNKDLYWIKNKILVRGIVDYISGMTDSFALNEYMIIYR